MAGAKEPIFTKDALAEIYRFSRGIPRNINNICDIALLVGCGVELDKVDKKTVKAAAEDLGEIPVGAEEKEEYKLNG